jgi:hypothetical protein
MPSTSASWAAKPRRKERKLILSHTAARGGNLPTDLAFALLNGQEFWYVQ